MGPMEERVQRLLEPTISALGFELLGVEYLGQGKHSRLRLFIDGPDGIGLDDCTQISHQVSAVLDVEDPIKAQYALEVSSPGLDRPLFKPEHYANYIGQQVKFRVKLPVNGQRNFDGQIQKVDQQNLYITIETGETLKFDYSDIERANLVPAV